MPAGDVDAHHPRRDEGHDDQHGGVDEGDGADADDLADEQLSWADHGQQHLDDPRRLLPGDRREHPLAVRLQQDEQQDVGDRRRGHAAGVDLVGRQRSAIATTSGGGVARTAAASSALSPAARSPLSRARSARSTLTSVGQLRAVAEVELAPPSSGACRRRTRRRRRRRRRTAAAAAASSAVARHLDVDTRRPGRVARSRSTRAGGVGPGDDDPLGVVAVAAEVGDDDDRGEGDGAEDQRDAEARRPRRLADLAPGDERRRAASRRGSSSCSPSTGPADRRQEDLGQAAAVEREVVDRPGAPGGVERRLRPVRRPCPRRRAAPAAPGRC